MNLEKKVKINKTKLNLLQAAKSILLTDGIGTLTVEAICNRANVSKGAFFYYFKTRDELLKGLLAHLLAHQKELYNQFYEEDELEFGRRFRAYIKTILSLSGNDRQEARAICRCMIELLTSDPALLPEVGLHPGYYQGLLQEPIRGGMSVNQAQLILLACEGLWYDQSLEVHGVDPSQVHSVIQFLINLTTKKIEV